MVRELRRFAAHDGQGRRYTLCEIAAFIEANGSRLLDGVPTVMTTAGWEARPTGAEGEYVIPKLGVVVREARPSTVLDHRVIAALPIAR